MILKINKLIFTLTILFFIFSTFSYSAKAAFRDDVNPDEAARFVEQERAKSKAGLDQYLKEQEQGKLKNEIVKVSSEVKNIKGKSSYYILGVGFLVLGFVAIGLVWFFTRNKQE